MPYVSRNADGAINGLFANEQSGYAEEYLPDDDAEVVAFLDAAKAPPPPTQQDQLLFDHENRVRALEGQPPLTMEEFTKKAHS